MESTVERLNRNGSLTLNISMRDGTFSDLSSKKVVATPGAGNVIQKSENGMSCWNNATTTITTGTALSAFITATESTFMAWLKPVGDAPVGVSAWNGQNIVTDDNAITGIFRTIVGALDRIWFLNYDGHNDIVGLTYNPRRWICVCGVHFGGNIYIYADGIFVATTASGNATSLVGALTIGDGPGSGYYGYSDTIIIANVGLSASEVSQLYGETHPRGIH